MATPRPARAQGHAAAAPASRRSTRPIPPAATRLLTSHERAEQILSRFTFGEQPREANAVETFGIDAWFEQQLQPEKIADAVLDKRLAAYPTLAMTPEQALTLFPDHGSIQAMAEGKRPRPADPQLAAVADVEIAKYHREEDAKHASAAGQPAPTDTEQAEAKRQGEAAAARVAGDLLTLPRQQRMAALLARPVEDRITLTMYLAGEQKTMLTADFTPREQELFLAMSGGVGSSFRIVSELQEGKLLRAVLSERQLQEVMTDFWFNHFNVYASKDADQWYTTSYERDAIRKHALAHFSDLLLATAESPAMMIYLDNALSIGPNSLANGVNPANPKAKKGTKGLNENYGREVMELHTLSVNGGYTQADVTALSSILTGWGVDRPNQGGPFLFDQKRHEPGSKQWLGQTIAEGRRADGTPDGRQEGLEALATLARSPRTAHFIAYLLAQKFVADEPPPRLVDELTATYLSSDGDIRALLRAIVHTPEFSDRRYFRNKVKTPLEFMASAFRSSGTDPAKPGAMANALKTMGMPLYGALPPTGYILTADHWMNSSALVDRLNFAYSLTSSRFAGQKFDSPHLLALALLSGRDSQVTARANQRAVRVAAVGNENSTASSGNGIALHALEEALIAGPVKSQTDELIRKQMSDVRGTAGSPVETLNTMTALILGSPDFQVR